MTRAAIHAPVVQAGPCLLLGLAIACGPAASPPTQPRPDADDGIDRSLGLSPNARPGLFEELRREREAPRHPSDGGGRAWIESVTDAQDRPLPLQAGARARIRLVYEAGPRGIAEGGSLAFRTSPFFEWDPPQAHDREAPGYTEVSLAEPTGAAPALAWDGQQLILSFPGRGLAAGERVHVTYGAGPALAQVDRFAEREARLWLGVDGDGDGVRRFLDELPALDIAPGPAERLLVVLPTTARPGDPVSLRVSVLDRHGSAGIPYTGDVQLASPPELLLPDRVSFEAGDGGRRTLAGRALGAGVFRVVARAAASDGLGGESNPLWVDAEAPRLRWGDLHGHSQLSDGTGTPEDYFRYARDVAGLDVAALTDHDHWGLRVLDDAPGPWKRIRETVTAFHAPGRFVALLGYEWTSLLHGHRHVLYFGDQGEVLSFLDPRYETPAQLWDALRGRAALTFAHHSAGGPLATNWRYRPDPELEPVTEIASVHGSSEAPDAPRRIYQPLPGNFVRDVLDDGVRLGFIGSGDSHDGHPGAAHLDSPFGGGLAAIESEDLTRDGILAALRARRVYATNGPRILLRVSLDGRPMGRAVEPAGPGAPQALLEVRVVAESALERIDLVTPAGVESLPLAGELEWELQRRQPRLRSGEYLYVRAVQRDGGAAWSSPFYAD